MPIEHSKPSESSMLRESQLILANQDKLIRLITNQENLRVPRPLRFGGSSSRSDFLFFFRGLPPI